MIISTVVMAALGLFWMSQQNRQSKRVLRPIRIKAKEEQRNRR